MRKVYLLWYENGVDYNELLAVYSSEEKAKLVKANAPHTLPKKWQGTYSYLRNDDPCLVIEEVRVL